MNINYIFPCSIPNVIEFGCFTINNQKVRKILMTKKQQIIDLGFPSFLLKSNFNLLKMKNKKKKIIHK